MSKEKGGDFKSIFRFDFSKLTSPVEERFLGRFSSFREGRQLLDEQNQELIGRIKDESLLPFQKDRDIAFNLLTQISERFWNGKISQEVYDTAIASLDALVPKMIDGRRNIAGHSLSPGLEEIIKSRMDAEDVDVMSNSGSWGSLPAEVKQKIVGHSGGMNIELTSNCTVNCSFCGFADKGKIKQKMSFKSIKSLLEVFSRQYVPWDTLVSDTLYWGTDSFDRRDRVGDLDYIDIAKRYWDTMKHKSRFLYTSTAIPIAEEFRVLLFAQEFIKRKMAGSVNRHTYFRVSMRKANQVRAGYIKNILFAIYGKNLVDMIEFSSARDGVSAGTPDAWDKKKIEDINISDVDGPSCKDSVVVGVKSVDGICMVAGSNERPSGQERFPILEQEKGLQIYTIPHHHEALSLRKQNDIAKIEDESIYPPVRSSKMVYRGDRLISDDVLNFADDPHRAFLKMIGVYRKFLACYGSLAGIPYAMKETFNKNLRKEIELVEQHLQKGSKNKSMLKFIPLLKRHGFIK